MVRHERFVTEEEALAIHMNFYNKFRSSNPPVHLISTMKQILKRSFDSSRLKRSESSCIPTKKRETM